MSESERDDVEALFPQENGNPCAPLRTISDSMAIILGNKRLYVSIFALTAFPLSLLIFSLCLAAGPLRSHVRHLEVSVARSAATLFEARQVWKESRDDALSLLRLRALYFLPSYPLSVLAALAAVTATSLAAGGRRPTRRALIAALGTASNWRRPALTSVYAYVIMLSYAHGHHILAAAATPPLLRLSVLVAGSVAEIYLMAVLSIGMVASIAEEKAGWEAIRTGSGAMKGRRVFGWVLSGSFALSTGWIGWMMERLLLDGGDWSKRSTVARLLGGWDRAALVALYGFVMLWGFVVTTVFFCHRRTRHVADKSRTEMVTA